MEQILNFRLDGGDLSHIAQNLYKLSLNKLSPFHGMPAGAGKPAEEALELSKDEDFRSLVQILARPVLRLSLRRGGSTLPIEASALFAGQGPKGAAAVLLQEDGGLLSATYFKSLKQYGEFFAAQNAFPVSVKPANAIKQTLGLEDLFFLFNLADCYRRAYLHGMLQDSAEPVDAIYEDEFMAVLEKEMKSADIRWLLPSFLTLTPGLEKVTLEFSEKQVDMAEAMRLISRGANPGDDRPIYYLDANGKYLGLEFSIFWRYSVGFETIVLSAGGEPESRSRYYFAPTDEANHLFAIISVGGQTVVSHQALTPEETAEQMRQILESHYKGAAKNKKILDFPAPPPKAAAPAQSSPPANKFCQECGAELAPTTAFCENCGTKVK